MAGRVIGCRQIGDVLTELREHGTDAVLTQSCRSSEGVLEPFPGHESPDGLADEPPVWRSLTKPWVCRPGE
jgi:hypothetical protein